ncbi:MAG: hypothetical protein ACR2GD_03360 [Pyrinomonadaceae bacterium]
METLLQEPNKDKGSKKILIIAVIAAVLAIAAVAALWSLKPSQTEVKQNELQGAFREGSPEFDALTKRIALQTVENATTKSMTGMGTRMMSIGGILNNLSDKTLTGLELKVTIVDTFNNTIKERVVTIIPTQEEKLEPHTSMPIRVIVEGIDPKADIANIHWKVTAIKTE